MTDCEKAQAIADHYGVPVTFRGKCYKPFLKEEGQQDQSRDPSHGLGDNTPRDYATPRGSGRTL